MVYNMSAVWIVIYCNSRAEKEVLSLPEDLQADFARVIALINTYGLENIHEPHLKHLTGKMWELRLKGRSGSARSIYVTAHEKKVVILHSFVKKTQQTPKDALSTALRRAKEGGYI